jgi:ParB family chromosome partitioning protein
MMTMKPIGWFKSDPNQPRKEFDEQDLDRLGDDLVARGVLVPLIAKSDGTLIDGDRRKRSAQRKGIKELPVIVIDKDISDKDLRGIQLATVFHRADLSAYERWLACSELMCMNTSWQLKDLAEFLHVDPSSITRLHCPSKTSAAWQAALKAGKVGLSDCYQASLVPTSEQDALLSLKLSGASRDELARASRQKRKPAESSVRLSRVKIAMPQGSTVVVTGSDLGMAEVVEVLSETLKEAKKAAEQYDVRTFQSMMRDRSKATRTSVKKQGGES